MQRKTDTLAYYLMSLPGIVLLIAFTFVPLFYSVIAFQKFNPALGAKISTPERSLVMAQTKFSGPVVSDNGFQGDVTADAVVATDLTTTGTVTINGTTIIISDLPTSDPEVEGQLYVTAGALMVSAGA